MYPSKKQRELLFKLTLPELFVFQKRVMRDLEKYTYNKQQLLTDVETWDEMTKACKEYVKAICIM